MSKQRVAVVIQFHNSKPNEFELISFRQCFKILGHYPIRFVAPQSLDVTFYQNLAHECGIRDVEVVRFNNRYFKSIRGYNKLLTSLKFYQAFKDFEFILLHHPDAFVFRDELPYWCEQGYDLIGPPMYEYDGTLTPKNYIGVGTSGFSLKRVASHIQVLKTFRVIYGVKEIFRKISSYNLRGRIYYAPYFIRLLLGMGNNSHHLLNDLRINDDIVWGILVRSKFDEFNVASIDSAKHFGLEFNCAPLLESMNNQLPFGCHLWYKGKFLSFWRQTVEKEGYTVPDSL